MNSQLTSKQLTTVAGSIVGAIALISGAVMLYKKKTPDSSSLESIKIQDEELAQRLHQDEERLQEDKVRLQEDEKRLEEDRLLAQTLQEQEKVQAHEIIHSVEDVNKPDVPKVVEPELSSVSEQTVHDNPSNVPKVVETELSSVSEQIVHDNPSNVPKVVEPELVGESEQLSNLPVSDGEPPPYSSVQLTSDPTQRSLGGGTRKNKITKKKSRKHYAILQKVKELLKEI
jgi:hypothetical protein